MNNFFTVEWIIKIAWPNCKDINFTVSVIEFTQSSILEVISNNKELAWEFEWVNEVRLIIKEVQEKIFQEHPVQ